MCRSAGAPSRVHQRREPLSSSGLLSPDGSALFPYQGKGPALKFPANFRKGFVGRHCGGSMLSRFKVALRSLIKRVRPHHSHPYVSSRVRRALALNRRHEARFDGLELKRFSTTLEVEWI